MKHLLHLTANDGVDWPDPLTLQIIATNTFWILFLRWKLRRVILISAFVGGWSTIGFIVSVGPGLLQKVEKGPFCAFTCFTMRVLELMAVLQTQFPATGAGSRTSTPPNELRRYL